MKFRHLLLPLLLIAGMSVCAQRNIRSVFLSYQLFEMSGAGNNTHTAADFLRDPGSYTSFLNSLPSDGFTGNTSLQRLGYFSAGLEWRKANANRFWKRYTLSGAIFLSPKVRIDAGSLTNTTYQFSPAYQFSPDTVILRSAYALTREQQFLGAAIGLHRRFRLTDQLHFSAGLRVMGSLAIVQNYRPRMDTFEARPGISYIERSTPLPLLKGRTIAQWQVMLPLAIEINAIRSWVIRLEGSPGLVYSQLRPDTPEGREAHGVGLSLLYLLR
jgi:hypothetical protein